MCYTKDTNKRKGEKKMENKNLTEAEKVLLTRDRNGYYLHESTLNNNNNNYNYSALYDNGGYCSKFN